ncbi:unnamed protein product, partial [marine sediment metagenome]
MNEDVRLIRILRSMKWQECKGNLCGLIETCRIMEVSRENCDIIHEVIYDFIQKMEK